MLESLVAPDPTTTSKGKEEDYGRLRLKPLLCKSRGLNKFSKFILTLFK
jgi:hypothetical protein